MRPWKLIALLLVAGLLVLSAAEVAALVTGHPVKTFTRDPAATGHLPALTGAVSMLNISLWAVIAALCAVAAWLVPTVRTAMVSMALLCAVLMADDALMLHEAVMPRFGLPEKLPMVFYGAAAVVFLSRLVRRRDLWAAGAGFLTGGVLLAVSVGVDQVVGDTYFLEDGAKLLGACVWLSVPVLTLAAGAHEARATVDRGSRRVHAPV